MTDHFAWSGAIKKNCVVFEEVPRITRDVCDGTEH
jgi:hypothetical protein